MARVLLITDEDEDRSELADMLESLDHLVTVLTRTKQLSRRVEKTPDVAVVRRRAGTSIERTAGAIRRFERTRGTPILAVVDRGTAPGVLHSLHVDDFLMAPVVETELAARLDALLLRNRHEEVLRAWGLAVDEGSHEASVDGNRVALTRKEYELLRFLLAHRGQVFGREFLLENLWGKPYTSGTRTVDIHIRRLRAKLGDPYASAIQTVRQAGYLFSKRLPK